MYGHMLLGFASFIENTCTDGDELWAKICVKAGINPDQGFFTHELYSDDIFFKLSEAAVALLGVPVEEMLERFGEYTFSIYWRKSKHDSLLDALGYTMDELINNLDALHLHLSSTYTKMVAPSFSCESLPSGLRVHYHSCRPGLAHYVKGILQSVAENIYRLNVSVEIEKCEEKAKVMLKNHCQLTVKLIGEVNESNLKRLRGSLEKRKTMKRRQKTMSSIPPNFHVAAVTGRSRRRGGSITSPDESCVDADSQWPITPQLFCQICPFHVLFDSSLSILSIGSSMMQLLPTMCAGDKLGDYFAVEVPNVTLAYRNLRLHSAGLFVIQVNQKALSNTDHARKLPRFRGQMIPLSTSPQSHILFLASPAVNSFEELNDMGMTSESIALSDPLHELLKNTSYFTAKVDLSDELERTKHYLQVEQSKLHQEKERIDHLLQAMLPAHIAAELKATGYAMPQEFSQISILFTRLENFDSICQLCNPLEVVVLLNRLFRHFDGLVEKHSVYKVETTGDSYMMAAGLPGTAEKHAQSVTDMAFDMREIIKEDNDARDNDMSADLELVIGIHSGPVVAGVIGTKLPHYCLFGDTVNTASRMNSTGEVGMIHISHVTYECLKEDRRYHFINRGKVFVKGLGLRTTFFVEANQNSPNDHINKQQIQSSVDLGSPVDIPARHIQARSCAPSGNHHSVSWTAPSFSSHIGSLVCDQMPIASS